MSNKLEELLNTAKLNELLRKKELEDEKKSCIMWGLAILGAVALVGVIAYAVYKHFTPDYLEDFEDDFDDFDDDFFEDVDDTEE
ncbi:DUF4366 domain-containing protein [Velocimicrobium porci]|uniref:DUF4366 domain-containing protein n=1 Tax=Velocimicrobium porci TaxID=2606634 RepID=A0A6L5XU12_9FIRM|nr:DUF4366 domain-containing protein [Velocimicrobium porci]MSS62290.1 DUF4366 domain-containing protein [Velocimicrobium porci]